MPMDYFFCQPPGEPVHLWAHEVAQPQGLIQGGRLRDLPEQACPDHDGLPCSEGPTQNEEV